MGSTIINKSNNNGYIDSKNEMISNLKKHMKSLEDQINLISKKIDNYKKIPGGEQTAKELEFKQCGLKTQQLDIKKQVEYYEKCITEQKNRIQNNKVSLKKDSIKNANTNLANFKTKIFKPGTISEKSDAEQTKETIWALAYEEKRIGGWNKMKNAYGNVDITEHALFGDPILKSYKPPLPGNGKPYDVVSSNGGRLLSKKEHNVNTAPFNKKLKELGYDNKILDLRWMMQGYLSNNVDFAGKEAIGALYNLGTGRGYNSEGAKTNRESLELGKKLHDIGWTLEDFAKYLSENPPQNDSYKNSTYLTGTD